MKRSLALLCLVGVFAGCNGAVEPGTPSNGTTPDGNSTNGPTGTAPDDGSASKPGSPTPTCTALASDLLVRPGNTVETFALSGSEFLFASSDGTTAATLFRTREGQAPATVATANHPFTLAAFAGDGSRDAFVRGEWIPNEESGGYDFNDVLVRPRGGAVAAALPRPAGQTGVGARRVAVHDGAVYWESIRVEGGSGTTATIMRSDGTNANEVATFPYGGSWIVSGSDLFYAERDVMSGPSPTMIRQVPVTGGTPKTLKTLPSQSKLGPLPALIGAHDGRLYTRLDPTTDVVTALSLDGGDDQPLDSAVHGAYLLGKDHFFIWTETNILKMPLAGGAATLFASEEKIASVLVDSCNVYWSTGTEIKGRAQTK